MKKRSLLTIAAIILATSIFTSCKEKEEVLPPMLGYWKCTGIGGNVFGSSTPSIGKDYLKYFSISYAGVGTSGYYARVGVDNIQELASVTKLDLSIWKNFLSAGSYSYDASAGTITHISTSDKESKTYSYTISNNGNTLKLVERTINVPSSTTVNNALDVLNSLLGTDNSINTSIGVEYTYEKMSKEDFNSLIQKK